MKRKEFISGGLSLTASMFIIRSSAMAFGVFVSSKIGAEQMGLFQLIMSVFAFAETVAVSGVPLAATTIVSSHRDKTKSTLKKCFAVSFIFGTFSSAALFLGAGHISSLFLKRQDAVLPLRLLSLSLLPSALSATIQGFFTGLQKIPCITAGRMVEDFSNMLIVIAFMKVFGAAKNPCVILTLAILISSVLNLICGAVMCVFTLKKSRNPRTVSFREILSVSSPVAAGSYIRSSLTAAENVMIPSALTSFGASAALAQYGTVKGMAVPVLTFPYVVLQSFISLLIPEISGRRAEGNRKSVLRASKTALWCTFVFGSVVSGVLLIWGGKLGFSLYNNYSAGQYITALSLLAVPMYIDSVTDAILKGLGEQVFYLKINIADSALRLVLIWILLPRMGVWGYIAVMYISELFNLALSAWRLKKI